MKILPLLLILSVASTNASAETIPSQPDKISSFDELESVPVPLSNFAPVYPYGLKKINRGGTVTVQFVVNEDGSVSHPRVVESSRASLLTETVKALYAWKFHPGIKGGQAVKSGLQLTVEFMDGQSEFSLASAEGYLERIQSERMQALGIDELDTKPEVVKRVAPEYPGRLKRARVNGNVRLEFVIDEEGKVIRPMIMDSSHPSMAASAVEALLQWEFKPGIKDGVPVKTRVEIPFAFRLRR